MEAASKIVRYSSPCAACKFLRRKCMPDCIFASYFPPEEPLKFAHVHKIFGASNVSKILNDIPPDQREDTVSSLAYEAEARVRDPVNGCVGVISFLQLQVERLQKELDAANAKLVHYDCGWYDNYHQNICCSAAVLPASSAMPIYPMSNYDPVELINTIGGNGYYQTPPNLLSPNSSVNTCKGGAETQGL